jgi:hypothetical protein
MRLVAYVTATAHRVFRWSAGALRDEACFPPTEAGLARWREYLGRRRGAALTVVIEVPGEEFREESIPPLRDGDRREVIERRLAQRFPETQLAAALALASAAQDGAGERWLLTSFAGAQQLEPWLDAVHESRVRLVGVTSTALLAPALIERCLGRLADTLLVSAHAAGLRECFLQGGRLRFARFEPASLGEGEAGARHLRTEVERLLAYLATLRALPDEGRAWPLAVVASEGQREWVAQALDEPRGLAVRFLSLERCAERLGLRHAPADLGAERLFLALAAQGLPPERFARPAERLQARRRQERRGLLAAGALGFAALAIAAGAQWFEASGLREEAGRLRVAARNAEQRVLRAAAPDMPTSAENLRLAVDGLRRLAAGLPPPEAALAHLSRSLEDCPDIELQALLWKAPADPARAEATAERSLQSLEITARLSQQAPAGARSLTEAIARFAAALQSDPAWQVVQTRLPFDLAPEATLRGGEDSPDPASQFVVVIARRPS